MISTNNPGNMRPGSQPWRGELTPRRGYCVFETPEDGLRAMGMQLVIYQLRHGCNTICTLINRWAPAKENNTPAYIGDVSHRTGIKQDENINLSDRATLKALCSAMIWHENGVQPYTDAQLEAGVNAALA